MGAIHIGTSGWSYKHWKDAFYPPKMKGGEYLSFYASHFKVTEINSSFYRLPTVTTLERWKEQVPADFIFCPKMSRFLSHMKKLNDPKEPLQRFFGLFETMKEQMGPVLIQLPGNAGFKAATVRRFYETLQQYYPEYNFAMEVRHESWFGEESLDLMREYDIAMVIAQSDHFPYQELITATDIYFRFHGPGELYASSYSSESLQEYAVKFKAWAGEGHRVWVFFNNDVNLHAIHNAKELIRFL
jgi:uncharacterized protein YecE (DUF72 family)